MALFVNGKEWVLCLNENKRQELRKAFHRKSHNLAIRKDLKKTIKNFLVLSRPKIKRRHIPT